MEINFNIIVLIITICFYVILRYYTQKKNKLNSSSNSNLIYVLCVPIILYISKYIYTINNVVSEIDKNTSNTIGDLLTMPYPVTTSSE